MSGDAFDWQSCKIRQRLRALSRFLCALAGLGARDLSTHEVRAQGRATQGVRIMNVKAGDEVAAVARIA